MRLPLILVALAASIATPATACRNPWRADAPVAFTATVESLERYEGVFNWVRATLHVQRRIDGPSGEFETVSASAETVTGWCHPREDYDAELLAAHAGDELVIVGGRRNGELAIYDLGRLTTVRGRELLAKAEADAARP